jgi:hypothetical protein
LWDSGDCAAATTELNLFKVPTGGAKTKLQTNMTAAGVIVDGLAYDVYSIAVGFRDGLTVPVTSLDMRKMIYLGYLNFVINGREQFSSLLSSLPWGGGVVAQFGAATDIGFTNGICQSSARYFFKRAVRIKQNIPFQIDLKWPVAAGTAVTATIVVMLDGVLHRVKQ